MPRRSQRHRARVDVEAEQAVRDQRAEELIDEERVAVGLGEHLARERRDLGDRPRERVGQHVLDVRLRERVEGELGHRRVGAAQRVQGRGQRVAGGTS